MCEFTIFLMSLWNLFSVKKAIEDVVFLVLTTVLLMGFSIAAKKYSTKKQVDTSFIRMACVLSGVGLLVAYPYGETKSIFTTILLSIPAFVGMYFVGKLQIHRWKIGGFLSLVFIPVLLLLTRICGEPIKDTTSYLKVGGHVLTLALLMLLLPLAMAFCFRTEVDNPFASKQTSLPINQIVLLGWTVVIAVLAGVVNNEYGTVLIICGSAAILFVMYGRNLVTKFGFFLSCIGAMLGVMLISEKFMQRFTIFIDIKAAVENFPMEAQPVKYIIDIAPFYGLFGLGNGVLSNQIYSNITSDYVISAILCNCGMIFTILVIIVYVMLIMKLLKINTETDYDRVVVETIAIMIFIMGFLSVAGVIGSFLLVGVGMPFVSAAKSINTVLAGLMGLVLAIKERGILDVKKG